MNYIILCNLQNINSKALPEWQPDKLIAGCSKKRKKKRKKEITKKILQNVVQAFTGDFK